MTFTQGPGIEELELSVFGPGFGESIAIHIGDGQWVLIDSCLTPGKRSPVALDYLKAIGVDPARAVKLVVISHWHDDHVRGMVQVVDECESALVAVSQSLRNSEFMTLTQLGREAGLPGGSGVDTFASIMDLIEERKQAKVRVGTPLLSSANKVLISETLANGMTIRVHALSPSDATVALALKSFADLLPPKALGTHRINAPSSNHASVALLIEAEPDRILLGADLERSPDPSRGWAAIINSPVRVPPSQVFKVSHHGSITGHHDDIWSSLLDPNPIAIVTPFAAGRKPLPGPEDIQRLVKATEKVYATALPRRKRYKPSERVVREYLEASTKSLDEVSSGAGHVRLRKALGAKADWNVELFGDAIQLS